MSRWWPFGKKEEPFVEEVIEHPEHYYDLVCKSDPRKRLRMTLREVVRGRSTGLTYYAAKIDWWDPEPAYIHVDPSEPTSA